MGKQEDLEKTSVEETSDPIENTETEVTETGESSEENLNTETEEQDDSPKHEVKQGDQTVPIEVYKGLQRTVSAKDKEIQNLKTQNEDLQKEVDSLKATMEKSDQVRADLEKRFGDTNERIAALEKENRESKKQAMKSRVIMNDYPELAKLEKYIPDADDEEQYRENVKTFREDLSDEVVNQLEKELETSTVAVEDREKKVSQQQVDKLYNQAMALASDPSKTAEYNAKMDEYIETLNKLETQ